MRAAVNRRNLDLCAQRRFRNRDRNNSVEIVATAFEERMRRHAGDEIEIPWRAAVGACIAAPSDANARASPRTGRNAHFESLCAAYSPFAAAGAADGLNLPGSAAARTTDLEAHLAAHFGDVAASLALGARLRRTDRTFAVASRAGIEARDGHFLCGPAHRFGERDFDLVFQI